MPRLFAAQPKNCSPVDASFTAGTDQPVARPVAPTIAEGTAIAQPLRLPQMIHALHDSRGGTVAVEEEDIVAALRQLSDMGLFVEPTSATVAAAYSMLLVAGTITPIQQTVMLLTGSGLKAATTVAELLEPHPT